ncbi:hypothetical protein N7462_005396 [Penicillium macrosclerotiorum]|uniref:uncharacterized protein n=1 Tax=Penicillium macrosclerotiorum TaxID=303699 RepID=UPI002546E478|nr:uncharacterized protein N7462_005396 [Penicillium macrosclerotiorum]KAJ5682231.1 hypothetical protein N7462_005396 [Penicillium macrosclerotiorum]
MTSMADPILLQSPRDVVPKKHGHIPHFPASSLSGGSSPFKGELALAQRAVPQKSALVHQVSSSTISHKRKNEVEIHQISDAYALRSVPPNSGVLQPSPLLAGSDDPNHPESARPVSVSKAHSLRTSRDKSPVAAHLPKRRSTDRSDVASFSSQNGSADRKRMAYSPRTPSPANLLPTNSVSVVIPSPSSQQRKYVKPSLKAEFVGFCEVRFPIDAEKKEKAARRAYPSAKRIESRGIPFSTRSSAPRAQSTFSSKSKPTQPQPPSPTSDGLRKKFRSKLKRIKGPAITFDVNDETLAALSANFSFVNDYKFQEGVHVPSDEFIAGCGCEGACDAAKCQCLIEDENSGQLMVAYHKSPISHQTVLRPEFLRRKAMISECNFRCSCAGKCWNSVTQRGRKIRLEIFDTGARGLGLRSPDPIATGQFIDHYLGEVLPFKDSESRESADETGHSYLFALDWMGGDDGGDDDDEELYIVDGQKFGTATRFMNHSCNPNCKIIPVTTPSFPSPRLYYLAFFATRDIPAGTELTFDYHPTWDGSRKVDPNAVKCLCGENNCRGQLWPNTRK